MDTALDEERCAHAERDVEGCHEAEVEPVGALERDPLAERTAEGVGRYKDPFCTGAMYCAETSELGDEWIHAISLRPLGEPHHPGAFANDYKPDSAILAIGRRKTLFCSTHPAKAMLRSRKRGS